VRFKMFGLEDDKKSKNKDKEKSVFALEQDIKDSNKYHQIKQGVEEKVQKLKNVLKSGEAKEDFSKFGTLLHGYTSLLKVMARCLAK
jgi:hypothetical protein